MDITNLPAIVRIGKAGMTEKVIEEVKKQLKKKKIIKVKFLKTGLTQDKKKMFEELAEKTESRIMHKVGFVVVLAKKIK